MVTTRLKYSHLVLVLLLLFSFLTLVASFILGYAIPTKSKSMSIETNISVQMYITLQITNQAYNAPAILTLCPYPYSSFSFYFCSLAFRHSSHFQLYPELRYCNKQPSIRIHQTSNKKTSL